MKKNAKIIIFSLIVAVFALAGLVPAFLVNYSIASPSVPTIIDDGQNICLTTSFHDSFAGYRFKFSRNGEDVLVDSQQNLITAEEFIEKGGKVGFEYDVSVCYKSKKAGNYSNYSGGLKWTCSTYLQAPTIKYETEINTLSWQEVDNCDYYKIYFNDTDGEDFIQTEDNFLNLQGFEGGERAMYVIAFSNNENIKTSPKSNILEFDLIHQLSEFSSISFDENTKKLTAENTERLDNLIISLWQGNTENRYSIIKFDIVEHVNSYTYTIDLTTIYNGERKIGISPANIDKFNIFKGNSKTIEL